MGNRENIEDMYIVVAMVGMGVGIIVVRVANTFVDMVLVEVYSALAVGGTLLLEPYSSPFYKMRIVVILRGNSGILF